MIKNYDEFIQLIDINSEKNLVKDICKQLMDQNNIECRSFSSTDFNRWYHYVTDSASIEYGNLVIKDNPNWTMVLHELCHLLVVEPELREFVDIDTNKSYKKLNEKYPENRLLRTESCTFGLQQIIMDQYDINASFNGAFFNGKVGSKESDVPKEWVERAQSVLDRIQNDIVVKKEIPTIHDGHIIPEDNTQVLALLNNGTYFKCGFKSGNYKKLLNNNPITKCNVVKWSYL